jgi:PAS domain S-box-containing protein
MPARVFIDRVFAAHQNSAKAVAGTGMQQRVRIAHKFHPNGRIHLLRHGPDRLTGQAVKMDNSKTSEATPVNWHTGYLASERTSDLLQTRPANPISDAPLASLIDLTALRSLLDDFTVLIGMPTALLDLEGNILQGAGWQKACTDFHRVCASSCANCTESDLFLASHLREGEFIDYKCKNGLWDVVTPVFVGKQHLGNLYCGQFFYDDDVIDDHFFIAQAERYGFEQMAYLAAIHHIPRFSRERVRRVMAHIVGLASYLSHLSLLNLKLSERQGQIETLINTLPDPVWLKDSDGVFVACNRAFERMLGASHADIIGKTDYDFCPVELAEFFRRKDQEALAASASKINEEWVTSAESGQPILLETIKTAVPGISGKAIGVLGIARDITERKREAELLRHARHEADKANAAKSRFLAAASHDLRQPLSALSMYAGMLKNTVAPADRKMVAGMRECIANLSDLLNDLLDLSKLDAGVVTPTIRDFAIADLLTNLTSVHAPEAAVKGLRLRCLSKPLTARCDTVLLKRILGNLIDNALRYTERGGVLIACRRRLGKIWVEVWDTGIGIAGEHLADIFEEFKQLGDGARNGGSGLGLAIVHKTAALLGLEISVRSRPGRGSVFALELPLGEAESRALAAPPPAVETRSLRIALVEDNAMVRTALTTGLRGLGHQVRATASREELLPVLDQLAPDIVISDYRLSGGETGYQVIAAVRARFGNELPAILITGDTDPKLLRSMSERGVVILHKPVGLDTLRAYIENMTGQVS